MSSQGLTVQASSRSVASKAPPPKAPADDDDDEFVDDGGRAAEEIGKTFTYRSTLSAAESAALESFRRRDRSEDDEQELNPLPAKQRNATYADIRQPVHTRALGPGAEALCIAASSSGNVLAVGGRHGTIQLLHPHTLEPMDTLLVAELGAPAAAAGAGAAAGAPAAAAGVAASGGPRANKAGGAANGAAGAAAARRGGGNSGGLTGGDGVVTSLVFRPDVAGSRMQNVLLAAQADAIVHVHVGTKRVLHVQREERNRINTLAMRADGRMFASAGSDTVVRVYDEAAAPGGAACRTLDHGDGVTTTGHTSHVFSLAWQPDDPQILLSGGWDNRVLVWDLRVHRSVRSISGPHICGDALDISPASGAGAPADTPLVLTGSWRAKNPLQLWDLGSGRLLTNLPWWQPEPDGCLPYAARFGTGAAAGLVVAGGSGVKPLVRVYKLKSPGNCDLAFTVLTNRPVHATVQVQGFAAAPTTPGRAGSAAAAHGAPEPCVAVACDNEVHLVSLSSAIHGPTTAHPHGHAGGH
ncbi:hypothetical protein HYH02_013128 [Chlamydomonas schloesseri]|uniref:Anaphase-promoting complex subunit 4 WD40 domain-containing protein n=1 Tax=Chlamydomonas schloesseri TaxID=2026947 RepID=A0A835W051_9CHLO|nr:hypothetical protein HYH02_013128 [Chlamydomonas schloesseri]KAG2432060.1 hypothetical protein HYH02_013128 [Chlamydomonas schloesseri]|eukprot:KAG2432059.1 hypothetical protein HYH02_013128 [Chlamydomonas schloesseri]